MMLFRSFALLCVLVVPSVAFAAEESFTVSITPPLFQLSIAPGETWSSSIKVVNTNTYDVTYFASVVNFESSGEAGTGKFSPVIEDFGTTTHNRRTLAQWIELSPEPISISKGQSADIPFTVRVPLDAEPGGHYAAVLVGTQPPKSNENDGPRVSVSSYVSSLFFVKINGDVIEDGRIREFVPDKAIYQVPDAKFLLRFENLGTVHVRPQGNITIYNMWGKERGTVDINQKSTFGNVLPKSIRRFEFVWKGEFSPLDIGRYSAVVTLAYGDEARHNVTATTYFWVVPFVPVATTLGTLLAFVLVLTFFIRRYVRRVIQLEKQSRGIPAVVADMDHVHHNPVVEPRLTLDTFALPIREGVIDLRRATTRAPELQPHSQRLAHAPNMTFIRFVYKYKLFFAFLILMVGAVVVGSWYLSETLVPSRTFEISQVEVVEEVQ